MKRNWLISVPLWVAGALMVLWFSMPHHHHEGRVCFVVEHCEGGKGEMEVGWMGEGEGTGEGRMDEGRGGGCGHEHDGAGGGEGPCSVRVLQEAGVERGTRVVDEGEAGEGSWGDGVDEGLVEWASVALAGAGEGRGGATVGFREGLHDEGWRVVRGGRAPPAARG